MSKHTDSNGREYVVVDSTDNCLWNIAARYLGDGSKYPQLASINNISNPNLIYTGQKIYLTDSGGGGSSSTSSNSSCPKITDPVPLVSDPKTLFVTWTWDREADTESYKVLWTYSDGTGTEWLGKDDTIDIDHDVPSLACQSQFGIPNGAMRVWVKVKPIAKKDSKQQNGTTVDVARYTDATWSEKKKWQAKEPFETPPQPEVTLKDLTLKAELKDFEVTEQITAIQYQLVKNNTVIVETTKPVTLSENDKKLKYTSYEWTVERGGIYKVRCRFFGSVLDVNRYSEWSGYSGEEVTPPVSPLGIDTLSAKSESSVYVSWTAVDTATLYEIQYTTNKEYFDANPGAVDNRTTTETYALITDMESGKEHHFRLRAINENASGENQYSDWTEISSIRIGTLPEPPTTWSSSSTVIVGEPLTLYWSHNCEDGSKWRYAEIRMYIDGVLIQPDHTEPNTSTDEDDNVGSYDLDTGRYSEGTVINWQVRTMGILNGYNEDGWSELRTIDIYAQPTLELSVTNSNGELIETLNSFPINIKALAGPKTQSPLSYHLSVISNSTYETIDSIGNEKIVRAGDEVYSKHFDISTNPLEITLSASDLDLENSIEYTIICTAAMNSGLTVDARTNFTVSWADIGYTPSAAIGINTETWTAQINPYCVNRTQSYHKVAYSNGVYTVLDDTVSGVSADIWIFDPETESFYVDDTAIQNSLGTTTTGEYVYEGVFPDGTKGYYCTVETEDLVEDITLSVYRREYDGRFVEVATGVSNSRSTYVTDPHPALDLARYRIVATTKSTGAIAYADIPGEVVGCKSIIIQWDEAWSSFNTTTEQSIATPPWSGSLLDLKYNVDVSDSNTPEVDLVRYIGRSNPIPYYGTQIGQTSTWNTAIPKTDKDTLYALRRLSVWMGNCYVREPSGSGYWANVKVTFNQKHKDVTIPVTFNITRVEGGV